MYPFFLWWGVNLVSESSLAWVALVSYQASERRLTSKYFFFYFCRQIIWNKWVALVSYQASERRLTSKYFCFYFYRKIIMEQ